MNTAGHIILAAASFFMANAYGQTPDPKTDSKAKTPDVLSSYVVDFSSGSVSAGGIVGVTGSAITNVQTSQDLVLAIDPLSSKSSKSGYGLSITPARTSILPVSGKAYLDSNFVRFVSGTTLSYAENTATISTVSYRKTAFSLDTSYYFHKSEDPVSVGYAAFTSDKCRGARRSHEDLAMDAAVKNDDVVVKKEMALAANADKQCVNDYIKSNTKWNASKISFSYGAGWIKPDATPGGQQSLGKTFAVNAILWISQNSAINVALNRTTKGVDLTTLAKTPMFKDSNLAAVRFSNYSGEDKDYLWLVEASNAKSSTVSAASSAFKYAAGIDKKIYSGIWLEFRLGRNYAADGTSQQTTSLLSLKFAPTSTLFGK